MTKSRRLANLVASVLAASGLSVSAPAQALPCGPDLLSPTSKAIGLHADALCREFYVDAMPARPTGNAVAPISVNANVGSGAEPEAAFSLHTRPDSANILYLDFDGNTWAAGSWWDGYYVNSLGALEGRVSPGYDRDGDPTTFTDSERLEIIQVWEAVAEDFAVFDLDVTTERPRGSRAELFAERGSWALILSDQGMQNGCGCGGVAHVDVFGSTDPWSRPALNFMNFGGWTPPAWDAAEIVAHEVGHQFGLAHDGTSAVEYYGGQKMWTPIMGAGRGSGIATWSAGGYPDSMTRWPQAFDDDFLTIDRHAPLLADTVGGNAGAAKDLGSITGSLREDGLINSAGDQDWFKFSIPAASAGSWSIRLDSYGYAPNLDPELRLLSSEGSVLATSNPLVSSEAVWGVISEGMDASISQTLAAGTYYVAVDGVGQGSLGAGSGYSDYASVGRYALKLLPPTPSIDSLSRLSGGPGTAVQINGSNLGGIVDVKFGSVSAARVTALNGEQLVVGVPAGSGVGYVRLFDAEGNAYQSAQQFDARGSAVSPTVTSLSQRVAKVDDWITVQGANLGAVTALTLAGSAVEFTPTSTSSLVFRAASGQRGGELRFTTGGGSLVERSGLRLESAPIIDSLSATAGYVGDTITVSGGNLQDVTLATFHWLDGSVQVLSDTAVAVTVPKKATSGLLELVSPWGKTSVEFTVLTRAPEVDSISPGSALPGRTVTLTGRWLGKTTAVKFNGVSAEFNVISDEMVTATVPATSSGKVTLITESGQWISSSNFTVLAPAPTIAKFTPAKARAGTVVTISGKNFTGAITVWFGGVKALKVQRVSATTLKVTVPPTAKTGYIQVKAVGGTVRSAAKFTRLK